MINMGNDGYISNFCNVMEFQAAKITGYMVIIALWNIKGPNLRRHYFQILRFVRPNQSSKNDNCYIFGWL